MKLVLLFWSAKNLCQSNPYNKKLSCLHLRKMIFQHTQEYLKFNAKQEHIIKGSVINLMQQKLNDKELKIYNFWSSGIAAPTHYLSQKYCFIIINQMARSWEFIISGFWVLTHPPWYITINGTKTFAVNVHKAAYFR